jgi:hypothetical protein
MGEAADHSLRLGRVSPRCGRGPCPPCSRTRHRSFPYWLPSRARATCAVVQALRTAALVADSPNAVSLGYPTRPSRTQLGRGMGTRRTRRRCIWRLVHGVRLYIGRTCHKYQEHDRSCETRSRYGRLSWPSKRCGIVSWLALGTALPTNSDAYNACACSKVIWCTNRGAANTRRHWPWVFKPRVRGPQRVISVELTSCDHAGPIPPPPRLLSNRRDTQGDGDAHGDGHRAIVFVLGASLAALQRQKRSGVRPQSGTCGS